MKKLISILLAAMLLGTVCCAAAETAEAPVFETFGEAIEASEDLFLWNNDILLAAIEKDGKYYRAAAEMDETSRNLSDSFQAERDYDKSTALLDEFHAYIKTLPVAYVEEITAVPASPEELETLIGKTIDEAEEAGFETGSGFVDDEGAYFTLTRGLFNYYVSVTTPETREEGDYSGFIIQTVEFEGLSQNAARPDYQADGTFTGQTDLFGGLASEGGGISLLDILTSALNGEGGENQDPEALINALVEALPEQEEEIRQLAPLFLPQDDAGTEAP